MTDTHTKCKRYKTTSKQIDVPVTPVAHVQKFKRLANLPGHGRRRKIDVTKEPRITSKEIKHELQGQDTSVSDRTFGRYLSQPWRTPILKIIYFSKKIKAFGRMCSRQMRQN